MEVTLRLLGCIGIVIVSWLVSGLVCMALWNWVIVALFGVTPIDYWLGIGISAVLWVIGGAFRRPSK